MMRRLFLAASSATVAAVQQGLVVHPAPTLPEGWAPTNDAVSEEVFVTVAFALREQNLDKLREIATEVSDPRSGKYGRYLSAEELRELTRPSDTDVAALQRWLDESGVSYSPRGTNGFEVRLAVKEAKALFKTEFYMVSNAATQQQVLRAASFSLPTEVEAVVTAVYGMHGLPLPPRLPRSAPVTRPANVTPSVLEQTYNVSGVSASGSSKNRQAVAEFQGQTMNSTDLKTFFSEYVKGTSSKAASSIYKFVGGKGEGHAGVEASLDVDYIMGVAPGVLTEFWYYGSMDFCGDMANWTSQLVSEEEPPLVHSVSYGWQGDLDDISCAQAQADDVDSNFVKLAARGVSIIISSGDSGSGYSPGACAQHPKPNDLAIEGTVHQALNISQSQAGICCFFAQEVLNGSWSFVPLANSSMGTCTIYSKATSTRKQTGAISGGSIIPHKTMVYPSWPASSPWVTAVGATRFIDNEVGSLEMATDQFGSGGGFSRMFDAFKDQMPAVQHYFQTVNASALPPPDAFPASGRATPDVAALGEGFQVIVSGEVKSIGGTSASAPTFAGFVSLLNEARLKAGKPAMGYLNPFLYQNPGAFRDVTVGTNAIGRGASPLEYGFPCAPGWDPATGLGTPNFEQLLSLALSAGDATESLIV